MKKKLEPQGAVAPVPAAMISCGGLSGESNIITLAWVGMVNSTPPHLSISVRPSRYSYKLVKETGEFVVNIPRADQVEIVDQCGVVSGKNVNKFERYGLTPLKKSLKYAPIILECPVNIECEVTQAILLNTHEMFVGKILAVWADEEVLDGDKLDFFTFNPLGFSNGRYLKATGLEAYYGFTARKKM